MLDFIVRIQASHGNYIAQYAKDNECRDHNPIDHLLIDVTVSQKKRKQNETFEL